MVKNNLKNTIEDYLLKNSEKIKINSKDIKKNDVFLSLKGQSNHGNSYIDEAWNNGAKYIITDKKIENHNKSILLVKSSNKFLLEFAKKKRNLYTGKVIGITGSLGKTTLKEYLKFFLSINHKVSASIKSYNN